jgi:hypothetical protein
VFETDIIDHPTVDRRAPEQGEQNHCSDKNRCKASSEQEPDFASITSGMLVSDKVLCFWEKAIGVFQILLAWRGNKNFRHATGETTVGIVRMFDARIPKKALHGGPRADHGDERSFHVRQ